MKIYVVYEEVFYTDSFDNRDRIKTPIKAFDNEEDAIAFSYSNEDYDVEEVEYIQRHK